MLGNKSIFQIRPLVSLSSILFATYLLTYPRISELMKLIKQLFDGAKRKLKELIDNVTTAFELVGPEQHKLLLKFVKTKITGEARSKLLEI
jgi:hypothetical protein